LGVDPTLSKFLKFSFKVFNFLFNLKIDNSGKINASLKIQIFYLIMAGESEVQRL